MHSPWGFLYQIVKETGWTWHYILWKVSYNNIMLMLADRSNFKYVKEKVIQQDGKDLARRIAQKKANSGRV